jgi:competence protein ComEC
MQWTSAPNIGQAPLPQRARGFWKANVERLENAVEDFLERERGQLPPWIAVGLGSGIAGWFALGDSRQWAALICLTGGAAIAGFMGRGGRAARALGWFMAAAALGCALVWLRSERVAAPRLDWPRVVSFEGRVDKVETLAARGDIRMVISPDDSALPPRVRVNTDAEGAPPGIAPGAVVKLRARLAPPPPMALPGSYDFARAAWFQGLGAVGRSLGPVEVLKPAAESGLDGMRNRLDRHIRESLEGPSGAIATALATGDQNALNEDDADAMRRSGLAHLLSVSGLHIAAVVGAAMFLSLKLLALSERLALRFNLVLVSAGVGAAAGIAYTLLTGAQVPTVRSCIAALLVLGGMALGRDAISLRLIAVGAILVLLIQPEALVGASFQLSFAAVTAIVALHSTAFARMAFQRRDDGMVMRAVRPLGGMVATGLAVEIALMPLALYHFHKAGLYGVAANIVAIPLTTFLIMPLEILAILLDAVGIGAPLWWLTGQSIDALLWVARTVAGARGAVATLAAMPGWAFAAMVGGGLWLCLWTSRARLLGLIPIMIGAIGAWLAPTPDLLVTGDGRHMALVSEEGTPVMLRDRTGDFARDLLAESSGFDGEPVPMSEAKFATCSRDACLAQVVRGGRTWTVMATRSSQWIDWVPFTQACARVDIVISDRWLPKGCVPKWLKLDRKFLEKSGGVALYLSEEPSARTVAEQVGLHPWR